MNLIYPDKDLRGILKPNSSTPIFDKDWRDGNRLPTPTGLTLLKLTDFSKAPLGQTATLPEIVHYTAKLDERAIVVDNKGSRVLRSNFNASDPGPDPISGQTREGNLTHYFNAGAYYSAANTKEITFRVKWRFDDSYWAANIDEGPFPYPVGDGKLFLEDKIDGQYGPYLGFKNFDDRFIRLVSSNGTGPIWGGASGGGWTNRSYGWRHSNGTTVLNGLDLVCDDGYILRTDGQPTELFMEVRYNPDNIGYHKVRFRSSMGAIYRDPYHGNSDADGWINFPIEWEFKGLRYYSNSIAFTSGRLDVTTAPQLYDGYAGGHDVFYYAVYSGVMPTSWLAN